MKRLLIAVCLISMALPAHAAKKALIVAVEKYQQPKFSNLRGCVNDGMAVASILKKYLDFKDDEIRILTNENATKSGILNAFDQWLIKGSTTGDNLMFFYAGHGFYIADYNGDEKDENPAYDETLCPHDTNSKLFDDLDKKGNMIIDDEIGDLLARLNGRRVLMIFDSCNSGTATRSIEEKKWVSRTLPFSTPRGIGGIRHDNEKVNAMSEEIDASKTYMAFLAAAGPREQAKEVVMGNQSHGALTLALIKAFQQKGGKTSLTDIKAVFTTISKQYSIPAQNPEIEGNPDLTKMPLNQFFTASKTEQVAQTAKKQNPAMGLSLWANKKGQTRFKTGDRLVFHILSDADGYLYLFDISKSSEDLLLIYPNEWSRLRNPGGQPNCMKKNHEIRLPPAPKKGKPLNFEFTADTPGQETILAILTQTPWKEMDAIIGKIEGHYKIMSGEQKSRILEVLQQRQSDRHVEIRPGHPGRGGSDWAGASLDIIIE